MIRVVEDKGKVTHELKSITSIISQYLSINILGPVMTLRRIKRGKVSKTKSKNDKMVWLRLIEVQEESIKVINI